MFTELEQLVASMCRRPGMYVVPTNLGTVCAFINGFDTAHSGGPLVGFHQWLVLTLRTGNNVHWVGNLEHLVRQRIGESASEEEAIAETGKLFQEYFDFRRKHGLAKVFHDFAKWQLKQDWYEGSLRSGPTSRSTRPRAKTRAPG